MFILFNDSIVDDIGKLANAGGCGRDVNVDDSEREEDGDHRETKVFGIVHLKIVFGG